MIVLKVDLPAYQVGSEPNHTIFGKTVDDELRRHFMGQTVVVRGIASADHPGKTVDELVEVIKRDGTDRYDPARQGDRYENIERKHIDFFAFRRKVTTRMQLFKDISWGFYHGAIAVHGQPKRIDILTIYDASKLKRVTHRYEGRPTAKRDGFVFKDPIHKQDALLGIIKIL